MNPNSILLKDNKEKEKSYIFTGLVQCAWGWIDVLRLYTNCRSYQLNWKVCTKLGYCIKEKFVAPLWPARVLRGRGAVSDHPAWSADNAKLKVADTGRHSLCFVDYAATPTQKVGLSVLWIFYVTRSAVWVCFYRVSVGCSYQTVFSKNKM